MRVKNQKDAGFTFVEVIVSMVIMMIGVIPLISLFDSSINNYNRATKTTVALNLAEEGIEKLSVTDLSAKVDDAGIFVGEWEVIEGSPSYESKTEINDISYDVNGQTVELYAIEIRVRWQGTGQLKEISLKNYSSGGRNEDEE